LLRKKGNQLTDKKKKSEENKKAKDIRQEYSVVVGSIYYIRCKNSI
jgi:hypothetical protein